MTRVDFTKNIAELIIAMRGQGELPILDFVKRSDAEQMRLFLEEKSKCDGVNNRSMHQFGCAADIYFAGKNGLTDPIMGWIHWHKVWESLGGKPEISWDRGHFE